MRKTNKLVALLLTLGMLLTLAIPMHASAAVSFSDIPTDHTYYTAITTLAAEGILNGFEDGTFKPEQPVTRAQFTKIVCYALNTGDLTYSESERAVFPDVAPNHWAINNIITAKNSRIINGYDDGTFKPENNVLYEQAVKMAVCALGYPESYANREGGYPNGYFKIANKAGLLDKITDAKIGQPLTRGGVAQLMDNFLDANMFDSETGMETDGSVRDETSTKATAEGRIVSIYGLSIYYDETSPCNKQQVELEMANGERALFGIEHLGIADPSVYLGRTVTVFFEKDRSADYYEAYNITLRKNRNAELTINLDDIESYTNTQIKYYDEDTEDIETLSVEAGLPIIHNNTCVNTSLSALLTANATADGAITLVCANSTDVADIAFLKTYETIVVGSKDTRNYKIYDHYASSNSFTLDETNRSQKITFTKDGRPADFSAITINSIVSVSESLDHKNIDVLISTATKKGAVVDILGDGSFKLDSGNNYYRLSNTCHDNGAITVGAYLTLYLDSFGKVGRYVMSAEKSYNYAYLAAAEFDEDLVGTSTIEFMAYTFSATNSPLSSKIYTLKENVKIDGVPYNVSKDLQEIKTLLASSAAAAGVNPSIGGTAPTNATYAQPVRFTTSAGNSLEIDSLLTLNSTGASFNISLNLKTDYMSTPIECLIDRTTLGSYSVGTATPILVVPSDRVGGTYTSKSNIYFKKDETYYVQFVNVSGSNKPAAIYVYGTGTSGSSATTEVISEDNIPMIVKSTSSATYMEQSRKKLTLVGVDGTEMTVYDDGRAGTSAISTVAVGDVIRVAADSDSLVDAIEVLATADSVVNQTLTPLFKVDGNVDNSVDDRTAPFRVMFGKVRSATANTLMLAPTFSATSSVTEETYAYTDSVKIYTITRSLERAPISEAVFAEIIGHAQQNGNGSNVMVYTADGIIKAIVVFVD